MSARTPGPWGHYEGYLYQDDPDGVLPLRYAWGEAPRKLNELTAQRDALAEALADVEKRCWQADAASRIGGNGAGKQLRFLQSELGRIESAARAALAANGKGGCPVNAKETGAFGLPFTDVGAVVQSMLACLMDRGYSRESIILALGAFDEGAFWVTIGPVVDTLAETLGIADGAL